MKGPSEPELGPHLKYGRQTVLGIIVVERQVLELGKLLLGAFLRRQSID